MASRGVAVLMFEALDEWAAVYLGGPGIGYKSGHDSPRTVDERRALVVENGMLYLRQHHRDLFKRLCARHSGSPKTRPGDDYWANHFRQSVHTYRRDCSRAYDIVHTAVLLQDAKFFDA